MLSRPGRNRIHAGARADMHRRILAVMICLSAVLARPPAFSQPPGMGTTSDTTVPASPTVMATVITRNSKVALVVLWRGEAGWFSGGPNNARSSVSASGITVSVTRGGKYLELGFEPSSRGAMVFGKPVPLAPDEDVILVDAVDRPANTKIVGTLKLHLEAAITGFPDVMGKIVPALQSHAESRAFLQCDAPELASAAWKCSN